MISDKLENLGSYYGLHPNLDTLIDCMDDLDLDAMADGRHVIRGQDVFLNLSRSTCSQNGIWEAHREYIDFQLILEGEESIAWAPLDAVPDFSGYDKERDLMQSRSNLISSTLLLRQRMFAIFFPEDAHKPGLGQGSVRKAVFKLRVRPQQPAEYGQNSGLNHLGTRQLRSQRLLLRPFRREDAEEMYANWCSDPEVTRNLEWETHPDAGFTGLLLDNWVKAYRSQQTYHWGIECNGELIGDIAVMSQSPAQQACEIGYCLSRRYWNRGLMTEALRAVMSFLFREVGFRRIVLRHAAENPASGQVMKKAGLLPEGTSREMLKNKQGTYSDIIQYAALRDEWLHDDVDGAN